MATAPLALWAQPTSPPPAMDPLMTLMLSQPRLDVTGPVTAGAAFEPPVVRPGEQSTYRVVFNALDDSIVWPERMPAPAARFCR